MPHLGLFRRKERWALTLRGWLVFVFAGTALSATIGFGLHPFLAVHAPVKAEVMVVEGWISDIALEAAAKQFNDSRYTHLYVTGGPLSQGSYLVKYGTYADLGVATLRELGVDPKQLVPVPAPEVHGNRTHHSAMALQRYFESGDKRPDALNVLTEGAHARRSRLLFQRALGDSVRVGIICIPDSDYDARRWWASSGGWRSVIGESVGYLYAQIAPRDRS